MRNTIQEAFGQVHATEQMKRNVSGYLSQQTGNFANQQEDTEDRACEDEFLRQDRGVFVKWSTGAIRPVLSVCMILILCLGFGSWYYWETPVSYVSIDVNPSIELVLNRADRVVRVESQNEDGALVLKDLQLKGKRYLQAVELLVESDAMRPYLTKDADLTLTVASPKAEELLMALRGSAVTNRYQGLYRQADLEMVHLAHACGLSLGRYQMYQMIAQYDDSVTAEDCQHMTMCQLHETLFHYEIEAERANQEVKAKETGDEVETDQETGEDQEVPTDPKTETDQEMQADEEMTTDSKAETDEKKENGKSAKTDEAEQETGESEFQDDVKEGDGRDAEKAQSDDDRRDGDEAQTDESGKGAGEAQADESGKGADEMQTNGSSNGAEGSGAGEGSNPSGANGGGEPMNWGHESGHCHQNHHH